MEKENLKMKRNDIIDWLRDKLPYAPDHAWKNVMQAAIDALQEDRRWIPVTERLPDRQGEYICRCCIDGNEWYPFHMVLRYYLVDKKPHFRHECEHGLQVTHWMPLPEPPKEDPDEM